MFSKSASDEQTAGGTVNLPGEDEFVRRHLGPNSDKCKEMLGVLGLNSLEELVEKTLPASIRMQQPLNVGAAHAEHATLAKLREIASQNKIFRSFIGLGYCDCITPPVIQRNILENPGWYTQYTPYQPEISQGRLEALLNFQTMISDLTGLEIANASLLDEGTAAAEAMSMSYALSKNDSGLYFVSAGCHPQTIAVVKSRASVLGLEVLVGNHLEFPFSRPVLGMLLQYPATDGTIYDYGETIRQAHEHGALVTVAADPLSLILLKSPGELGADIAVGNTQRFGVPLGFGGPHAAYLSTREAYKRQMPGRLVGLSIDSAGKPALRLALQTREQHIRREKATSNICTAQVLLAVMAGMYAVYHGPKGLKRIAERIHHLTALLSGALKRSGFSPEPVHFFDTLQVRVDQTERNRILARALQKKINLCAIRHDTLGISLDETTTLDDLRDLLEVFAGQSPADNDLGCWTEKEVPAIPEALVRKSGFLTHPVFNSYHSETEMLRYIRRLESRDLSLTTSMIPLGSCTMKLNAAAEMYPISWPEFSRIHPFAPAEQTRGYQLLFEQLERWLAEITGFAAVSLQPNAGSQGEYAGLLVIRRYHEKQGEGHRNICLIPQSAHGTNPASAVMAGLKVVVVACDSSGNIDVADLKAKIDKHGRDIAALMVTYPSTHGVFEEEIQQICAIVHACGAQVYMDGANMNAQVGLCRPGEIGADVCHLNLHKTFCIPHGGGGPGMGPIAMAAHLAPFRPGHPLIVVSGSDAIGAIASAPWGSPSILPIPWIYITLMGSEGLTEATMMAILNANYIARRLDPCYPVLYKGKNGMIAHECIIDLRPLKKSAGIEVDDVAKRLMDYGFHAPTMSFPVPGTMMVEPTESESKEELDRFCEAMISIRREIEQIETGAMTPHNNLLKNAPHTASSLLTEDWSRPYTRERAAYPTPWTRSHKFWPPVGRIDNVYGDRHLICTCLPMEAYSSGP